MALTITPVLDDLFAPLGTFIKTVIPTGVPVVQLPTNRASMPPPVPGFVGMRFVQTPRISTNVNRWDDQDPLADEMRIEVSTRIVAQLDCYGASSGDWAQMLVAVLRDEYGVLGLAPRMSPLFADDPRFAPLIDGEEEYEQRWIVNANLQYNPVTSTDMQFANEANAVLINVDESYPP